MKVLTVHGGPETDGNSRRLLNECISGMREIQSTEIESVNIYDYNFDPPVKKPSEGIEDGMKVLRPLMLASDIIVISMPVYMDRLSGKLKQFIDRWTEFILPDGSTELKDKGLALLNAQNNMDIIHNNVNTLKYTMMCTANLLGMVWMGAMGVRARMPWEWSAESSLVDVRMMGIRLAQGVNLTKQKVL